MFYYQSIISSLKNRNLRKYPYKKLIKIRTVRKRLSYSYGWKLWRVTFFYKNIIFYNDFFTCFRWHFHKILEWAKHFKRCCFCNFLKIFRVQLLLIHFEFKLLERFIFYELHPYQIIAILKKLFWKSHSFLNIVSIFAQLRLTLFSNSLYLFFFKLCRFELCSVWFFSPHFSISDISGTEGPFFPIWKKMNFVKFSDPTLEKGLLPCRFE